MANDLESWMQAQQHDPAMEPEACEAAVKQFVLERGLSPHQFGVTYPNGAPILSEGAD